MKKKASRWVKGEGRIKKLKETQAACGQQDSRLTRKSEMKLIIFGRVTSSGNLLPEVYVIS